MNFQSPNKNLCFYFFIAGVAGAFIEFMRRQRRRGKPTLVADPSTDTGYRWVGQEIQVPTQENQSLIDEWRDQAYERLNRVLQDAPGLSDRDKAMIKWGHDLTLPDGERFVAPAWKFSILKQIKAQKQIEAQEQILLMAKEQLAQIKAKQE